MGQNEKKNSFFLQGLILAGAGIITKIIGFLYRIPMANLLGEQGNGIYSIAFGIYNVALTLSSYSLPLAVSKLVSARLAKQEYTNVKRVFTHALLFALIAGGIAAGALYGGARKLETLYECQGLAHPLTVLAPTVFVVAFLGVFRGFFQGHGNMVPTALSQIMEQVINAIVSVLATWHFVRVFAESKETAAYGAAGGTMGTLMGAVTALVVLVFIFAKQLPTYKGKQQDSQKEIETSAHIYKVMMLTILPVILSQTIYQIGYTIDDLLFGNLMIAKGWSDVAVSSVRGVFNTQYNQLINLPVAIATAMAASTIPSIVRSITQGKMEEMRDKTDTVLKFNLVIAIPAAMGLAALAEPIIALLFPRLQTYHDMAVNLLETGSLAVVFYAVSTITTAILQGSNYMRLPVLHSGISLFCHIGIIYAALTYTNLGVYGLILGNVTFPLLVCVLNVRALKKRLQYKIKWGESAFKPFLAALFMGICGRSVYVGAERVLKCPLFSGGLAFVAALLVYFVLIIKLKVFSKEELSNIRFLRRRSH